MWFFVAMIVVALVAIALMPTPKFADTKAGGLADMDIPTVSAAKAIAFCPGTNLIQGPNCLWFGDLKTIAITDKVKSGFKSTTITIGHKYYLGLVMALCWGPIDSLRQVRFANFKAWTGNVGAGTTYINKPTLFGAADAEGGVQGYFELMTGTPSQAVSAYFQSMFPDELPGFRYLAYWVWKRGYIGNQAVVRNPAFEVSMFCRPSGFDSTKAIIDTYDANPAYILWDALTNPLFGAAIPVSYLNPTSFQDCANTLFDEEFGLSFNFTQTQQADAFQEELNRHIDGTLYSDPVTGLISLKLIRDDYVVGDLEELTDTDISDIRDLRLQSLSGLYSEVKVKYTSRSHNYRERVAVSQNTGVRYKLGYPVTKEITYPGVKNGGLANKIATRDIRTLSSSPISMSIVCTRKAYNWHKGMPFKINSSKYNISGLVCRVQDISFGTLESGKITIKAVQDTFQVGEGIFLDNPGSEFIPIDTVAKQITDNPVMDTPYFLLDPDLGAYQVMLLFRKPGEASLSYDLYSRIGGAGLFSSDNKGQGYMDASPLNLAVTQFTATIRIDNTFFGLEEESSTGIRTYGNNMILLGDPDGLHELVCFEDFVFNTIDGEETTDLTLCKRGLLDTVPRDWVVGTPVYYLDSGQWGTSYRTDYTLADSFQLRPLDNAFGGQFDPATATIIAHVIGSRPDLPFPPARVSVEGNSAPGSTYIASSGGLDFAWVERNRLTALIQYQSDATEAPEAVTTYTFSLRHQNPVVDVVDFSVAGLSGVAYTLSEANEKDNIPFLMRKYQALLQTQQGGQNSFTTYYLNFNRTPYLPAKYAYFNEAASGNVARFFFLNETSGTTVTDRSGAPVNATYVGSPSLNNAQKANSNFGNSVHFDGANDHINLNELSDAYQDTVCLDLFFRLDASVGNNLVAQRFLSLYSDDATGTPVLAFGVNNDKLAILTREDDDTQTLTEGTTTLSINTWYRARFIWDGQAKRIIAWLATDLTLPASPSNRTEEIYVELPNFLDAFSTTDNGYLFGDPVNTARYFDGYAQNVTITVGLSLYFLVWRKPSDGPVIGLSAYDCWDPDKTHSALFVRNDYRRIQNSGTAGSTERVALMKTPMRFGFFTAEFSSSIDTRNRIGFATSAVDLTQPLGSDTNAWALSFDTGGFIHGGVNDGQANDAAVDGVVMLMVASVNGQHTLSAISSNTLIATLVLDAAVYPEIFFACSVSGDTSGRYIDVNPGDVATFSNLTAYGAALLQLPARSIISNSTDWTTSANKISANLTGDYDSLNCRIQSGALESDGGSGGKLISAISANLYHDQYSQSTIATLPADPAYYNGPVVRASYLLLAGNSGYGYMAKSTGAVDLVQIADDGTITVLVAGTAAESTVNSILRIEARDLGADVQIKAYINGVLKHTYLDATYLYKSGMAGLYMISYQDGGMKNWSYGGLYDGD
jgi:hypothetical protein